MPGEAGPAPDLARESEEVARLQREIAELRSQLAANGLVAPGSPPFSNMQKEASEYPVLLELSPQVVWMSDSEGNNIYSNRYWCELTGLSPEQTVGHGWTAAIHAADLNHLKDTWQRAVAQKSEFEEELRIRRARDGEYRWHLMRGTPLYDSGATGNWMGIAMDINDRKVAGTAIAQANERTRLALDAADIGTWDLYPDTGIIECSPRCLEIFQASNNKPTRDDFLASVHKYDRERVTRMLERAINPQVAAPYDIDYRIVRSDGSVRWVYAKGKGFFSGEGTARVATRFSGMIIDVTERRAAERDRAGLAAALQHSPDYVGITDLAGRVLFLNRVGQDLVGLRSQEEARTKTALDFLAPAEQEIVRNEMLPVVRAGKVWQREFTMRHFVTGEPVLVETRVFGIFDEQKRLIRMVNLSRDISEKRKLDERMHMTQKMDAVGRLAGGIAHDFNNLLTIIRGATEMLLELQQETPRSTFLKEIGEAAERASMLTDELLAFGRQKMVRPRSLNINRAVLAIQAMLQRVAGEDVHLRIDLDEGLGNVKMDPLQIDQILINLVANARDAMPHGGEITIRTFNQSSSDSSTSAVECACLKFSDTGQGLAPALLGHIFEPFFSTENGAKTSGLGLASVYGIVHQANGQIEVESVQGQGTSFTIYLPHTSEEAMVKQPAPPAVAVSEEATVLLVEDESGLRTILAAYLREHGYSVYEAGDAQEATAIAEEHAIDLLLTDIVMPGVSGAELASILASPRPNLKVIFMSGYADHTELQSALKCKNAIFLHKPFRFGDLISKIREASAGQGGSLR